MFERDSGTDSGPGARRGRLPGKLLALALVVIVSLSVGVAQPAHAQDEGGEEEPGPLARGWAATQGFLDGVTGPDFGRDSEDGDGGGEDGSGDGSGEDGSGSGEDGSGSGDGSGGGGPGGEPGPGGEAGQGTDDTGGEYGAWTKPINIAQGLIFICAGIGLAAGILTVGMAAGSTELHQKGIKMIGGTLAGFVLGMLAVQIYNALGDVVVGF